MGELQLQLARARQNFEFETRPWLAHHPHDTTPTTCRDERVSATHGRACLGMARSQDGRRQRVLPQCRDERNHVGEAR